MQRNTGNRCNSEMLTGCKNEQDIEELFSVASLPKKASLPNVPDKQLLWQLYACPGNCRSSAGDGKAPSLHGLDILVGKRDSSK